MARGIGSVPVKRRRRNSGSLRHLQTEVWATIHFLSGIIEDDTQPLEARLKAAAGICVSAGVYRSGLQDRREEARRELQAELARQEATQQLRWRESESEPEVSDVDADPDDWEEAVAQAIDEGTLETLEQSRALAGLPRPNKALVQAAALADVGRPKPVALRVAAPVVRPLLMVTTADPEDIRLAALERQVKAMLHAVKQRIATPTGDGAVARGGAG
jgi:hypothetical protein